MKNTSFRGVFSFSERINTVELGSSPTVRIATKIKIKEIIKWQKLK